MVVIKGLAMTAADIFSDESFRKKIREYHKNQVPKEYRERMKHA